MIIDQKRTEVLTQGITQVVKARIVATPKVFDFFSNMTYSNKRLAVLRELVANAIDAHAAAGNPEPIEVFLPTIQNPTLRVKDKGIGMAHEFITGPFMDFGDGSTKHDTNDQIGGFGIGSKAPLAVTDQFMIRSVCNGQAGIYSVFRDDMGIPSIGVLDLIPTDEPNGVEVIVPADPGAYDEVARTALMFFSPRPKLHGGTIDDPGYMTRGEGWAVRKDSGPLGVIMGGIRYPVDTYTLPFEMRQDPLVGYGVDLTLPIGSCKVALSRESLSLDEDTIHILKETLAAIKDSIVASFSTMFDECPNWWEARKALSREVGSNQYRGRLVSQHARYRGEILEEYIPRGHDLQVWSIRQESRRQRRMKSSEFHQGLSFAPGRIVKLIIDDLPVVPASKTVSRIRHHYEELMERDRPIVVVRGENAVALLGYPPREDYVLTSELDPPPPVRRGRDIRTAKVYRGHYPGRSYLHETTIYDAVCQVVMNNFEAPDGFREKIGHNLIDHNDILYVNKVDEGVLDLPSFDEVYEEAKAAFIAEHGEWVAHCNALAQTELVRVLTKIPDGIELTPAQQRRPFGRIVQIKRNYFSRPLPAGHAVVEPKMPPRLDPDELLERFKAQQWPLAQLLGVVNDRKQDLIRELA